jgi:hypothetical protein
MASERKPGHRRRQREPGEGHPSTLRKDGVKCKALSSTTGEPCQSNSVMANGLCVSHQRVAKDFGVEPIACSDGLLFGSKEQVQKAASGNPSKRYPKLQEVLEEKLEQLAEQIVGAHLQGLIASRMTVDARGEEHIHPDHDTRWRAAAALLDRALGRPVAADEPAGAVDVTVNLALIENPVLRDRASELRRAIAAGRPGSKFGPGA